MKTTYRVYHVVLAPPVTTFSNRIFSRGKSLYGRKSTSINRSRRNRSTQTTFAVTSTAVLEKIEFQNCFKYFVTRVIYPVNRRTTCVPLHERRSVSFSDRFQRFSRQVRRYLWLAVFCIHYSNKNTSSHRYRHRCRQKRSVFYARGRICEQCFALYLGATLQLSSQSLMLTG